MQRRTWLSVIQEPSPATVLERPCTIILAQDDNFYHDCWHERMRHTVVENYGFSYAEWWLHSHRQAPLQQDSESHAGENDAMDDALRELSNDLSHLAHQTLFIARGPCISWVIQFYLESFPLAGLILVDPIPFDDTDSVRALERFYEQQKAEQHHTKSQIHQASHGNGTRTLSRVFYDYANHGEHWSLRLEPGAVPMLIVSTQPQWESAAQRTRRRHIVEGSDIPLLSQPDFDTMVEHIVAWIDDQVL